MTWRAYQVIFRLRSSLHIGCGKIGNLNRTRPYVTGRVLWGALTMRLTRDQANWRGPASDSRDYQRIGQQVQQFLAFTYFYPATKSEGGYRSAWFWQDEANFKQRFLSSYSGTAFSYPYQSVATGMLHEVEYISPTTLDKGEPVFLLGYIFERDDNKLAWQAACKRLQMGGERGYGWGAVELVEVCESKNGWLFNGKAIFNGKGDLPVIRVPASEQTPGRLLAHTLITNLPATGEVEPLVGREWRSHASHHQHVGQHVTFNDVCFSPGSTISQEIDFSVVAFGMWRMIE